VGEGRAGWRFGALGAAAATLRNRSDLPAAVLRALPCVRDTHGALAAVPALLYPSSSACRPFATVFAPPLPGMAGGEIPGRPFKGGQPDPMCSQQGRAAHPTGTETDTARE
jgi:hypothetical protein